jgi:hypothetical protein
MKDVNQLPLHIPQTTTLDLPPSSLAITSALSSALVYAIELLEFPNEIPIAFLPPGPDTEPFDALVSSAISKKSIKEVRRCSERIIKKD